MNTLLGRNIYIFSPVLFFLFSGVQSWANKTRRANGRKNTARYKACTSIIYRIVLDNKGGSNRRHSTAPHHLDPPPLEPLQQLLWMTPISINPATKRDSSLEQPSKKINSKEGYERILPSDRCLPSSFLLSLSLSRSLLTLSSSSRVWNHLSSRLLKNSRGSIHPRRFRPRFIGESRRHSRPCFLRPPRFLADLIRGGSWTEGKIMRRIFSRRALLLQARERGRT